MSMQPLSSFIFRNDIKSFLGLKKNFIGNKSLFFIFIKSYL